MDENSKRLEKAIKDFVEHSPENSLKNENEEKAWAEPIVGFASGNNPVFSFLKEDIGDFLWTPHEIFTLTFPQHGIDPEGLTVISWVLPQTEPTKSDNRAAVKVPSERWLRARKFGEEFNVKLAAHVVDILCRQGYLAVAPSLLSPDWKWQTSQRYGFSSNWSERHAAYAAGLGTFGLCDGLITKVGKAIRCGSVVANIRIIPSDRPYDNHLSYCSFHAHDTCGKCIPRCPAGAISKHGHDKDKCMNFVFSTLTSYVKATYGFESYGCGLCQTGVPCESEIPPANP